MALMSAVTGPTKPVVHVRSKLCLTGCYSISDVKTVEASATNVAPENWDVEKKNP